MNLDETLPVKRRHILALSNALGKPTTVQALDGETVEDCLVKMAAQRLSVESQNVMPHGIAHLLPPITLTGHQLRWALMMANPDGAGDPDQLDTAVSLQAKLPGKNTDGEDMPAGLYCWLHEYPEEGSICIDGQWIFGPDDFNFHRHLARQRAFSERTFGPGIRTQGVVDHIRKELIEILAEPTDLSEWIDVAILALDGAWRTGATPEQIIAALVAKQEKNEARQWPDWRTAPANQAIEHVRHEPESLETSEREAFDLGAALIDAFKNAVSGPLAKPEPCPVDIAYGLHACADRSQCFEACGQLGHSAVHARPVTAALHTVHCPNGPVHVCAKHLKALSGLIVFLGAAVAVSPAHAGTPCGNCLDEAQLGS